MPLFYKAASALVQSVKLIEQYLNSSIYKIEVGIGGSQLMDSIARIQISVNIAISLIFLQLECCGAHGPGDWRDPYEFCCRSGRICFRIPQLVRFTLARLSMTLNLRFSLLISLFQGCVQAADQVLTEGRLPLGITIIVLGVIEMGAVACAASLTRQIRRFGSNTVSVTQSERVFLIDCNPIHHQNFFYFRGLKNVIYFTFEIFSISC